MVRQKYVSTEAEKQAAERFNGPFSNPSFDAFIEGWDAALAHLASLSDPTGVEYPDVAKVVWETSRADEGTISATGANHVAKALLAKFKMEAR
ncbi:hypothetical protein [Aeromicrobium sp. 179-A 4D2 NHS]|uniref:hypothetical protein n=1 Tax=Aeromicrobium sp. 179-A 4D2 NHS TaxID=3142375 RepID=UPI00399FA233